MEAGGGLETHENISWSLGWPGVRKVDSEADFAFIETGKGKEIEQEEENMKREMILFTQPLHSGKIWHKVNFLSGV